jgi:hypothetical protein
MSNNILDFISLNIVLISVPSLFVGAIRLFQFDASFWPHSPIHSFKFLL